MEKKECKSECKWGCNCKCLWMWTLILILVLAGCWAALWTCMYKKVDAVYKLVIEMSYGSSENFSKLYDAVMTEEYVNQITEQVDAQVESMTNSNEDEDYEDEDIDVSWDEFEATSAEAYSLFGLSGTPGNAIIDRETRNFKAVGGAYPQESFEEAIAALKDWSAVSDEIGKAGTLTEEQLSSLLDGAYFKDDNKDAKIIIVEYSDLLCPYCKRHYNNRTLENIIEADSSIALVFKNMPIASLHPTAPIGAKWVECAGKLGGTKAFYDFLDAAFQEDSFSSSNVKAIATKLGLDESDFDACFNS